MKSRKQIFALVLTGFIAFALPGRLSAGPMDNEAGNLNRESLISAILENNKTLHLLEAGEMKAGFQLALARAAYYPKVNFSADFSYIANPDAYTIAAGDFYNGEIAPGQVFILPNADYKVELSQNTRYKFDLTMEQPLYTWGKFFNGVKAAELGAQGSLLERELKAEELITSLDLLLQNLRILKSVKEENNSLIDSARDLLRLSDESHRNGFLLYSDLLSVKIRVKEAELAAAAIEEQRNRLLIQLHTLTGLSRIKLPDLILPPPLPATPYVLEQREGLTARALEGNLSLKMMELATEAAAIKAKISRAAGLFRPDIGLYLNLSYTASKVPLLQDDWEEGDKPGFIASLGLRSLLFDGGESSARSSSAAMEVEEALMELNRGCESVAAFIGSALYRIDLSEEKIEYHRLQIEIDREREAQKREAWQSGYGEEREVLKETLAIHTHRIELLNEEAFLMKEILQLRNVLGETGLLLPALEH